MKFSFLVTVTPVAVASFVPACIVEQCSSEAKALAGDGYAGAIGTCVVENFGPCAGKAWDCLGDVPCREVVTCAPTVLQDCGKDIWTMMTDAEEREKVMCISNCIHEGSSIPNPICVATKCGKAAVECLTDKVCLDAAVCVPKALLSCGLPALNCVLGADGVCRENLQCLGHGLSECADPAVNILTDAKIADLITCAGTKCEHPTGGNTTASSVPALDNLSADDLMKALGPIVPAEELLCIASKCGGKVAKILVDNDTKDLLGCALRKELREECSSVWDCLGDSSCSEAVKCWAAPFDTCKDDVWAMFTDESERKLITDGVSCLSNCQQQHADDFTEATFCVMDNCADGLLQCWKDEKCREAVKCLPETVGTCATTHIDAYAHQDLFKKSVKCVGHGLESCGRGAVEMLRDQNIADAINCASQCTHAPTALV